MLKLNRTTEYGLMSLTYIRSKSKGELTSAREIADHFELPFEILAKTLQRLKEHGLISSSYGTRGGYVLACDLATIDLAGFLGMMEGPVSVVACQSLELGNDPCGYKHNCNIKHMMNTLNARFYDFMHRISLEELTRATPEPTAAKTTQNESAVLSAAFQGGEP